MAKITDLRPRGSTGPADHRPLQAEDLPGDLPDLHWFEKHEPGPLPLETVKEKPVPEPKPARPPRAYGGQLVNVAKRAAQYLLIGLASFFFFSLLFYGYNLYQDRQRAQVTEEEASPQTVALRVLNGADDQAKTDAVKQALEQAGYEIRNVGTATTPSASTVIYYRGSASQEAVAIAQVLASFNPTLEKNDTLAGIDDVVIIVGTQ